MKTSLSEDVIRILKTLAIADHDLYGLDLVAAGIAKRSGLYVMLGRMEDEGLIEGRDEDTGNPLPRRIYRITDAGREYLLPTARVR